MSTDLDFERLIADVLTETAPSAAPESLVPRVLASAGSARRRPGWLARMTEHPMRLDRRIVYGSPAARGAYLLSLGMLVVMLAGGGAIGGATLLTGPTVAPRPTPVPTIVGTPKPTESPEPLMSPQALTEGTHLSANFEPRLRFTVPRGWRTITDEPTRFVIELPPLADGGVYCPDTGPNWGDSCAAAEAGAIGIYRNPALAEDGRNCEGASLPTRATTASETSDALKADPRLVVNETFSGGFGGGWFTSPRNPGIDIQLTHGWTGTCEWNGSKPSALLFVDDATLRPLFSLKESDRIHLILFDTAGETIAITVARHLDEHARPVVDSFEFDY